MAKPYLRTLNEYESDPVLPLAERAPGVYEQELLIRGNSILATVFVDGADPGATVKVQWWDATTGKDLGEEFILGEHDVLTSGGVSRKTITRIHDKPTLRATVEGGNATFSVYVTVVSAFASDLDSSLKLDGELVKLLRDKGVPLVTWDTSDNTWRFLVTNGGRLQLGSPPGAVVNMFSSVEAVARNDEVTILSHVSAGIMLTSVEVDCENVARFKVLVDGEVIAEKGTYFGGDLSTVFNFSVGDKVGLEVESGKEIQVKGVHRRPDAAKFTTRMMGVML